MIATATVLGQPKAWYSFAKQILCFGKQQRVKTCPVRDMGYQGQQCICATDGEVLNVSRALVRNSPGSLAENLTSLSKKADLTDLYLRSACTCQPLSLFGCIVKHPRSSKMIKQAVWIAIALAGTGLMGSGWDGTARAQALGGISSLSAGPAYTSKDGQNGPQFPRIDVVMHLTDGHGTPRQFQVGDLKLVEGDTELGSGESVRSFGEAGYGVKTILALDASGSMNGAPLAAIHSSIAKFVNQARPQDQVEVLTIADETRVEVPFGTDQAVLAGRLKQVKSWGTLTRLYDGLLDALAQLNGAPPAYRRLTVISDGHDEGSRHSINDVIRQAQVQNVPIDAIGLTRSHPEYLQTLARIAQATGGGYAEARSAEDLDGLIGQGIEAMRATPVAAFTVSHLASDGKTHKVELRWQPDHLTATFEVYPPLVSSNPWKVWGWVLAGCFVVGATLLIVSRRQQVKATEDTRPMQGSVFVPLAAPPAPVRSGFTVVEEDKPTGSVAPAPAYAPTMVEESAADHAPLRTRTRVAAFFDTSSDGHGPTLEATAGPLAGQSFPVSGDLLIGAVEGNSLVIPGDPTISGFHARLRLVDAVLTIEDSRSTNGTFVNGVRLGHDRKLLKPDDEIRMGRSIFRVRRNEGDAGL